MAVFITLTFLLQSKDVKAGIPCSHIMICCRENNKGITFLVNGKWNGAHDYSDISQVADVLQKIKDAGINIVIIDMTNESQWNQYWHLFEPMVNNIQQVCKQKNMQFIVFIGAAGDLALWNKKAERIWKLWGAGFKLSPIWLWRQSPDADCLSASRYVLGTLQQRTR